MNSFVMTDSDKGIDLILKPVMDLSVAEELRHAFMDCMAKEKHINVMAGEVVRITTPCLQLLLALKNEMVSQDKDFWVIDMSEPFQTALKVVGLDQQFLNMEPKA